MKKDHSVINSILATGVTVGYTIFLYGLVVVENIVLYSIGIIVIFICIFFKTFKKKTQ